MESSSIYRLLVQLDTSLQELNWRRKKLQSNEAAAANQEAQKWNVEIQFKEMLKTQDPNDKLQTPTSIQKKQNYLEIYFQT